MRIVGWRIGSLPLPAFLAPSSVATESGRANGVFTFRRSNRCAVGGTAHPL